MMKEEKTFQYGLKMQQTKQEDKMQTHKKIHSCNSHKPTLQPKIAREYFFLPPKKNYFPTLLFLIKLFSQRTGILQTCTDIGSNVNRFVDSVCGLETVVLRGKSTASANKKINANFLFGGFIASYESLCVNEQLCFVSTVVRTLPQIKNFVYPLCVMRNPMPREWRC